MNRISVFFDTNIIESRFTVNQREFLFHGKISPSKEFYDIINYVREINVGSMIDLYIHSVSWKEYNNHLKDNFVKRIRDLTTDIQNYNKSFGSLFDSIHEFKINSETDYEKYIALVGKSFLQENSCSIINYPNDISFFEDLIDKCIQKRKPFIDFKVNGKQYHDGGFKDAVIIETIFQHKVQSNNSCIFITNDNDFNWVNEFYICNNITNFKRIINEILKISDLQSIENKITASDYFKEQLIVSTGNKYADFNEALDDIKIINTKTNEDGNFIVSAQLLITHVSQVNYRHHIR